MATLSAGDIEVLLRLQDQLSPALKKAEGNVSSFVKNNQASFAALGQAGGILGGAIAGLVAGIAALGARGSDVADVAAAFDQLTEGAGGGEAAIETLRTATDGLISDFDLMTSTNQAFSQGLRLSSDDLRLVGESSRILADQIGGDTKEAYDTLTAAMATGRDRQLQTIGLNIDGAAAVEKLAASLGVEKGALTESQEVMAKKNAILDALRQKLEESGRAELDFGERIQQARVMMGNFIDTLGVAIAQSPVLNAGLKAVGDMLDQSFGTNKAETIKTLIDLIEQFAIWLVKAGQVGVEVARVLANAWYGTQVIFNAFLQSITQGLSLVVGAILTTAQAGAAALPDMFGGKAMEAGAAQLQKVKDFLDGFAASQGKANAGLVDSAAAVGGALDQVSNTLGNVGKAMEDARGKTTALKEAADPLAPTMDKAAVSTKAMAEAAKILQAAMERQADAWAKSEQEVADWYASVADKVAGLTGLTKAQADDLAQWAMAWSSVADKASIAGGELESLIGILQALADAGKLSAEGQALLNEAMGEMARRASELQGPLIEFTKEQIAGMKGIGETAKTTNERMAGLFANMADGLLVAGDLFVALGADAEGSLVRITDLLGGLAGATANVFANLASGNIPGAVIAGVSGVVNFFSGIFNGGKKAREELQKLRAEFIASMGGMEGLRAAAQEAGISLEALFDARKADELKAAIGDIQAQLDLWTEAEEKTLAAMEKYGITIDQMGESFAQLQLDQTFGQLFEAYQLLAAGGADVALINEKMAADFIDYVQQSIRAGTEIPAAMRPILEAMERQGLLTDANGEKLVDLEDVTWAETMTEAVDRIVDSVRDLVEALSRALSNAGSLGGVLGDIRVGNPTGPAEGYEGKGTIPITPPAQHGMWIPGRSGGWMVPAGEAGDEALLNKPQIQQLAAMGAEMAARSMQLSSAPTYNLYGPDPATMLEQMIPVIQRNERDFRERLRLVLMDKTA